MEAGEGIDCGLLAYVGCAMQAGGSPGN